MATARGLRLRKSFRVVEEEHYLIRSRGLKTPTELEDLILAFKGVQELPPTDPNSFFVIAGYHGEPFRGAGWSNSSWWGGYCYHGQILFPTWHRGYVNRLELALRSIPGCEKVTLPFLDWCSEKTLASGLPDTFTMKKFTLRDGKKIDNPLYSYTLQTGIFDNLTTIPDADYTKLKGYETVRYPLSGLVGGSDEQREETAKYNAQWPTPEDRKAPLNDNVVNWLDRVIPLSNEYIHHGTYEKFRKCLEAPNYTLFSNTSSAYQYNQENLNREKPNFADKDILVVPLESPHNDMHLAVGGYSVPPATPDPSAPRANGDMGENDTASFDPIFFFHHCYVDRMFWLWQLRHNQATRLLIDAKYEHYPGTNNFDSQGPTPGRAAGEWLSLTTPLEPFVNPDGTPMTSLDVIDIENSLGYTYGPGSFSDEQANPLPRLPAPRDEPPPPPTKAAVAVSGLSRGAIRGSFVISTWGTINGEAQLLGLDAVLSRWHTQGCANCQTHLNVKAFVPLHGIERRDQLENADIKVKVHTHDDPSGERSYDRLKAFPVFRDVGH